MVFRSLRRLPLFAALLFVMQGCVSDLALTDTEGRAILRLRIVPEIAPLLLTAGGTGDPTLARIEVRNSVTGEVLNLTEVALPEGAEPEPVEFRVELMEEEVLQVEGVVRLFSAAGRVEWSGRFAPTSIPAIEEFREITFPMGRGDLANLDISRFEIAYPGGPFLEGIQVAPELTVEGTEEAEIFWVNPTPGVLSLNGEDGEISTLLPGTGTIVAVAGTHFVSIPVEVVQRVATLEVAPAFSLLTALGQGVTLSVRLLDPRGAEVQGREVVWSGGDGVVVPGGGVGRYTASAQGVADIRAAVAEAEGSAQIEVRQVVTQVRVTPGNTLLTALGDNIQLAADARDANDFRVEPVFPIWSSDGSPAVVLGPEGAVEAVGNGVSEITATIEGIPGRATVRVEQRLEDLILVPAEAEILVGDEVTFEARATDRNGREMLAPLVPRWSIVDPAIASVNSVGVVRGDAPGTTMVRVTTALGRAAFAPLTVIEPESEIAFDLTPGTSAPPATLGEYTMSRVPYPGSPACTEDSSPLPTKGGGMVTVTPSDQRCIGSGWATWSHGYGGDVYFSNGSLEQTITFPEGTHAFYLYVEPNPFSLQNFEVIAQPGDVSSGSFTAHGSSGAAYIGVYAPGGGTIESVTIIGDTDFATGTYGWAGEDIEEEELVQQDLEAGEISAPAIMLVPAAAPPLPPGVTGRNSDSR